MTDEEKKRAKAEYDKEYRERNKEKVKEKNRKYSENNKEKILEYQREHYINNKEKLSQNKKEYYQLNKERILERCKRYRENNPKEKTGLLGNGNYNITLAERHKEEWLKTDIYLYKFKIIDINDTVFYKVGLSKNIRNRLYGIPYEVEVLEQYLMNKYDAVYKEKELLTNVNKYIPLKKFGGYTECFIN